MLNNTEQDRLHMQFKKVLILLEQHYSTQPTPMLEMIISRYQNANDILEKNNLEDLTKDMFKIGGSVRAYLESYSDYMNPMLGEMEKAENMLKEFFH
ncbi:hypothetical protein L1N85_26865 [Paenibacillus alkaliterrae]|uniref:hypothetical protein n=1 Tax=Paenibacillus alkaliterrae TaxID=320909 RepID=UPI001F369DE1|nr:hypothetical protein [Paenibacillus alkaliterrae]MCF2941941.1 hypothetical protein [Paenibacillus alkaliterrae]